MANTKREENTRETQSRAKSKRAIWTPSAMLDTPPAPEGYKYKWVRHELRGQDDSSNVIKRERDGYEPVQASELSEDYITQVCTDGKHAGVVRNGDLILCKAPIEMVNQRNAHYAALASRLQDSVDEQLMRHQNEAMPVSQSTKSTVSRGKANFEEE